MVPPLPVSINPMGTETYEGLVGGVICPDVRSVAYIFCIEQLQLDLLFHGFGLWVDHTTNLWPGRYFVAGLKVRKQTPEFRLVHLIERPHPSDDVFEHLEKG